MATFKEQIEYAGKGGCIVKHGAAMFNPTVLQIKEAQRKLSANVSGSISQSELLYKPKTQADYIVFGSYVIPVITILFT